MKKLLCAALVSVLFTPAMAVAQDAPAASASLDVKRGAQLYAADGKRIGRIERVVLEKDGSPRSVAVIYGQRFVYVPYASLSMGEKGVVTSVDRKDLGRGR